jgi:hypothetical protein
MDDIFDMSTARYIDSLKNPRILGFEWPEAEDPDDLNIFRSILEKGARVFTNDARDGKQAHSYTVGFYLNFLQPEIVILGVSNDLAVEGFGRIRAEADSGKILKAGDERADLFPLHYPVRFVSVEEDIHKIDYLDCAAWFYRSLFYKVEPLIRHKFPVLQAIWADKNGFYPDDPRCEDTVRRLQTLFE